MRLSRNPSHAGRGGFTLIELLVVIAIIAILMALTAAAVMRTLGVGPRVRTRVEIGQLDGSVEASKVKYGKDHIPSRLFLRKFLSDYYSDPATMQSPKSQLDQDSVDYLTTIFKGIKPAWTNRGINWTTSPTWVAAKRGDALGWETLEGDQCLVFFLGGIQVTNPNGCVGFSTDNANPDKLGGDRVSFYEFKSNRLVVIPRSTNPKSVFFSYVDGYEKGSPYAYFSANVPPENNYNKYYSTYKNSDCATLGVWPYAESLTGTPRYLKPKTFQIISAGADGKFGPGTNLTSPSPYLWTTATAASIPQQGADDQANFNANALGTGPQ